GRRSRPACWTVWSRKPSPPVLPIQSPETLVTPRTTSGRSVHRSSRPKKSPYSLFSPAKVESPRLWYIVGSFSHAGTLTFASAAVANVGVYGKDFRFTFGKSRVPSA